MAQWYFSYGNNTDRIGPLDDEAARAQARNRPDGYCWKEGFTEWKPIRSMAELGGGRGSAGAAARRRPACRGTGADEIDYRIVGSDMQFVEIELDPGESAIAEAGALMYKEAAVQMDTVFGDGSHQRPGWRPDGQAAVRRQARGHRREPVHHRVHPHRHGQGQGGLRRALPRHGAWR